jgi:hypothetical protein
MLLKNSSAPWSILAVGIGHSWGGIPAKKKGVESHSLKKKVNFISREGCEAGLPLRPEYFE